MPLKDEHENHDILFQDTENMPRNKKAMWVMWSEWRMKMTYVMKKNQMPGQYHKTVQKEKKTIEGKEW